MTVALGFFLQNFTATWLEWMASVGLTLMTFVEACWIPSVTQEERSVLAAAFEWPNETWFVQRLLALLQRPPASGRILHNAKD